MSLLKIFCFLYMVILMQGCSIIYKFAGGNFAGKPKKLSKVMSAKTKELIDRAFNNIDQSRLVDFHTHIVGLGTSSDSFINPSMKSILHPKKYIQLGVYLSAAGIKDRGNADSEFISRLTDLIRNIPKHGRYMILAFDKHYKLDGTVNLDRTEFYVSNEYVFSLAQRYPKFFVPVISVHPYRMDAVEELTKWAKKGVKMVKWLPNSMGIDPSHPLTEKFYRKMSEYKMILLSHTGEEQAVEAEEFQKFGNPLLLRFPLKFGVRVLMSHCGSLGSNVDLDDKSGARVSNFKLFLRMMDDRKYDGLLFGEISALVQYNRFDGPLETLLERVDLHHRLVNGSDYPLPGVNFVIRTKALYKKGFLTWEEKEALDEIYRYNPLLFDFVLKRTIRHPKTKQHLSDRIFTSPFAEI